MATEFDYLLFAIWVGGIFCVLAICFKLLNQFSSVGDSERLVRERLVNLAATARPAHLEVSLVRQKYLTSLSPLEQSLENLPVMIKLGQLIEQSGRFFPAYRLVLASSGSALLGGLFTAIYIPNMLAVLVTAVLSFWLPIALLKSIRNQRLAKFEELLPDALDMMTRALRAGHRFNETLHMVAMELPEPISSEFGITFDELNYGVDIRVAFNNLLSRVPSVSLMALVTSVLVQRESGGNLAETLQSISAVVRGRFKFQRKVKTLTAEGRMSAWVLALIPVMLFGFLKLTNPSYIDELFIHPLGLKILGAGLGLMGLGALWIRKLLQIEV